MTVDKKIVYMARERMQSLPDVPVPAGYCVRPYRAGEANLWTRIVREAGASIENTDLSFQEVFPGDEALRARRIFFAEDRVGRPVGTIAAWHGKNGPEGGGWGSIQWLSVLPAHRKQGLGSALVAHALKEQATMHTGSFLETEASCSDAIRLFVDAGFTPWLDVKGDRQIWKDIAKVLDCPHLDEILNPPPLPPAPEGVVAGLKEAAIPLIGCEAGRRFDDLRPFKEIVKGARIVSLGEATHGTREFFQLKHRIIEYLVVEMGFTAFAIEANMPECQMLDRFVTTGEGDPLDGITNMGFWTWNTEEVLDLVLWMRRHNEHATRPVRFYGVDMQSPTLAVREVLHCLRYEDHAYVSEIADHLLPLCNGFGGDAFRTFSADQQQEVVAMLKGARARIEALRYSTKREHALACLHASVAVQAIAGGGRDRAMAENVRDILKMEGSDGRIALWAHNAHVAKADGESMGHYLDEWFGNQHVVFGFAFGNGSFQARDMSGNAGLRDFTAPQPPPGSLDETLARTGLPILALDLDRIPPESEAGQWIREPRETRNTGAGFSDDPEETTGFAEAIRIAESYDALLFIANTTAARPNPDGRRLPPTVTSTSASASVRDYMASMAEGLPREWNTQLRKRRAEYDKIVDGGSACLRREGVLWDADYGVLYHAFDAAPYRGIRVRLSAEGRASVAGKWDHAHLAIAVYSEEPDYFFDSSVMLAFAATLNQPWTNDAWEARCLEIEVPAKADTIAFVFALAGNGTAWIRSIRLDPVP